MHTVKQIRSIVCIKPADKNVIQLNHAVKLFPDFKILVTDNHCGIP